MLCIIPINYKDLHKMTQTSMFDFNGKQFAITLRKSTISDNCYITIQINGNIVCENRVCTCGERLLDSIVDEFLYPEWIYFGYSITDKEKNFDYKELGETLFLFCWDRNEDDLL